MKKLKIITLILVLTVSFSAQAFDIKDLKGILGGSQNNDDKTSSAANLISNLVSGFLSNENLTIEDLVGTWKYDSPAVTFKSEDLLKKAGGLAAASTIEEKLAPYYKTTGLDKLEFTVDTDSTFTFKARNMTFKGTIETIDDEKSDYNFRLTFSALGRIKLGSFDAYISKSMNSKMDIMFDVSKLIDIAQKVSVMTQNATTQSAIKLLQSYDGVCAGFTMNKTK